MLVVEIGGVEIEVVCVICCVGVGRVAPILPDDGGAVGDRVELVVRGFGDRSNLFCGQIDHGDIARAAGAIAVHHDVARSAGAVLLVLPSPAITEGAEIEGPTCDNGCAVADMGIIAVRAVATNSNQRACFDHLPAKCCNSLCSLPTDDGRPTNVKRKT